MTEVFFAWYSGNQYEWYMQVNRVLGPYAPTYVGLIFCNILVPQLLWSHRVRSSPIMLFFISLVISVGMWLERFVIVVTSLHRDFLPSSWDMYYPTFWDWSTYLGTIGLFFALLFIFIRVLPMISIFEMRELVEQTSDAENGRKPDHGK